MNFTFFHSFWDIVALLFLWPIVLSFSLVVIICCAPLFFLFFLLSSFLGWIMAPENLFLSFLGFSVDDDRGVKERGSYALQDIGEKGKVVWHFLWLINKAFFRFIYEEQK